MSISESDQDDLLDQLAEEFAARFRRGERPSLKEYTDRHPNLADQISELFPAMVMVEQAEDVRKGHNRDEVTGDFRCANPPVRQIGDYRILREIGRGGMGVVYEAEQISLGRRVALKVLPRQGSSDRMVLERFRREARAAARLHHTNIVPIFEIGQDGDVRFYAMQLIQGQGLDLVITELRQLRDRAGSLLKIKAASYSQSLRARGALLSHHPGLRWGRSRWKPHHQCGPARPPTASRHQPIPGPTKARPNPTRQRRAPKLRAQPKAKQTAHTGRIRPPQSRRRRPLCRPVGPTGRRPRHRHSAFGRG